MAVMNTAFPEAFSTLRAYDASLVAKERVFLVGEGNYRIVGCRIGQPDSFIQFVSSEIGIEKTLPESGIQ